MTATSRSATPPPPAKAPSWSTRTTAMSSTGHCRRGGWAGAAEAGGAAPGASVAAGEGVELVDEDYDDVVDGVLLWWRDEDGDLVDALVDALTPLADGGYIVLLTPKAARDGHVEPSEIGEAAPTAGLSQTSTVSAGKNWSATRLVAPKARR